MKVAQSCPTLFFKQSMEFSRSEYWIGLPFPSPILEDIWFLIELFKRLTLALNKHYIYFIHTCK